MQANNPKANPSLVIVANSCIAVMLSFEESWKQLYRNCQSLIGKTVFYFCIFNQLFIKFFGCIIISSCRCSSRMKLNYYVFLLSHSFNPDYNHHHHTTTLIVTRIQLSLFFLLFSRVLAMNYEIKWNTFHLSWHPLRCVCVCVCVCAIWMYWHVCMETRL